MEKGFPVWEALFIERGNCSLPFLLKYSLSAPRPSSLVPGGSRRPFFCLRRLFKNAQMQGARHPEERGVPSRTVSDEGRGQRRRWAFWKPLSASRGFPARNEPFMVAHPAGCAPGQQPCRLAHEQPEYDLRQLRHIGDDEQDHDSRRHHWDQVARDCPDARLREARRDK